MSITRRQAIQVAGAAAISPLGVFAASEAAPAPVPPARVRLAVSTYSYWHFKTEKYPIERVIEHAAALGFDGVEILHRGMASEIRPT